MILVIEDFDKYRKVKNEVEKNDNYFLSIGDFEYFRLVRSLNVELTDLPDEADILQEVKDILILEVSIQVCSGLIGQNAQAISEGIVIDPWKEQLDNLKSEKEIKYSLIGKNHFIADSTEFDGYTAKLL